MESEMVFLGKNRLKTLKVSLTRTLNREVFSLTLLTFKMIFVSQKTSNQKLTGCTCKKMMYQVSFSKSNYLINKISKKLN